MTPTPPEALHLLYVADPMCSWCYGFSPVITALSQHFGDRLPIQLLMGGLRAGNTRAMTTQDKTTIAGHWRRVADATGQPFDHGLFEREDWIYDTEPACRAVVTMRLLNPRLANGYLRLIQQAFYAENRDTTSPDELADLAAEAGLDRAAFMEAMLSPEARNATKRDFRIVQETGISGFPTLLAGPTGQGYAIVTNGYRPLDGLAEALETWLAAAALSAATAQGNA